MSPDEGNVIQACLEWRDIGMAIMTILSHEYNEETGVDVFVVNPGNMTCELKVTDDGVEMLTAGKWRACTNPFLKKAALEAAAERG